MHTYTLQHKITLIYSCMLCMYIHTHRIHTYSLSKFIFKSLGKIKLQMKGAPKLQGLLCTAKIFMSEARCEPVRSSPLAIPVTPSLINMFLIHALISGASFVNKLIALADPNGKEDTCGRVARAGKLSKVGGYHVPPFREKELNAW